jgi:hypothetical protein
LSLELERILAYGAISALGSQVAAGDADNQNS